MKSQSSQVAVTKASLLAILLSALVGGWLCELLPWLMGAQQSVFSTGIPWLKTEADCVQTGRTWQDETCWDAEHDPTF
ncbi:MAG: hypothetical protein KME07_04200 [Pegethrix bostrychoides GSE-TBD4-15B]|jgi:hypothetical protein|uniref:Uncharacterized protein n=1 Tax=Pegethrix bostrychoides GSE-TBD4-15B TaxID=2839662 RepID=A0A951U4N3_9CYAN|nr:hypothetical protein [Pegethrix bostrychoides GSE-TBD4-15B]